MADETDVTAVNENVNMESKFVQDIDIVASNKSVKIHIEPVGEEKDLSQNIPNVVQTLHDVIEVDFELESNHKTPEYPENISETQDEINGAETIETRSGNSENLDDCGWDSPTNTGTVNGEDQSLNEETDNLNTSKIKLNSLSPLKESLSVPANSELLKDERQNSVTSNVRKGSKLSLLSSISRRSMRSNFDFTTVQMPTEEKSFVPLYEDSWIRIAIPYLPLWAAILFLLLNILIPGSGTILSGFSILCCAKSRVPIRYDPDPVLLICANTWVGLAQFFTITFLLVGWFWSIAWGIKMVVLSLEQRRQLEIEMKKQVISAFESTLERKIY